jgi:hypothetical protein
LNYFFLNRNDFKNHCKPRDNQCDRLQRDLTKH